MKVYLLQNPKTGKVARAYRSASSARFIARALRVVEGIHFTIVTMEVH